MLIEVLVGIFLVVAALVWTAVLVGGAYFVGKTLAENSDGDAAAFVGMAVWVSVYLGVTIGLTIGPKLLWVLT